MLSGITTLGPGNRFVLWTQGCMKKCPGCISPESRSLAGGRLIPVDQIAKRIITNLESDGITISGGEPFLQARALCAMIDLIKCERDIGVIVYTGYTLIELRSSEAPDYSSEFLKRIDLLIDGPYLQELNDDRSLRGSSNQSIIPLTDRYKNAVHMYGVEGQRKTEIRGTPTGIFVAGIPAKGVAKEGLGLRGTQDDKDT